MTTVVSLQIERVAVDFVDATSTVATTVSREIDLLVGTLRSLNSFPVLQAAPVSRSPTASFQSALEGAAGFYVVGTIASGERYKLGTQLERDMLVLNTPVTGLGQIVEAQLLVDSPRPPTTEAENPVVVGPTGPTGPTSYFYWGN